MAAGVLGADGLWTNSVRWTWDVRWFFQRDTRPEPARAQRATAMDDRPGVGALAMSAMKRALSGLGFASAADATHGSAPAAAGASPSDVMGATDRSTGRSVDVSVPNFDAIVSEHGPYVWRVLRRLGVRASDIDDVWQETFIVVHRKLGSFEGRAQLRTWLSAIAVRVASDYRSRAYRRREQATEDMPEGQSDVGPGSQHDQLVAEQRRALLDKLIAELKPEQREVIVLYEFAELPMQEVAEALGCPLQTAYSRLHAARKALESAARREAARKGFV